MSRLWPERLLVSLAPDAVALARVRGIFRPRLVSKRRVESERPIEALRDAIGAIAKNRMRATVVLSNRFVRYAVVPFDPAVSGPEEELALARFHFSRIHGERAKGWDVRISEEPAGAARLACAIDAGLIADIRACFPSGSGVRLVSVQPYLMAAYNRWRNLIAKRDAWLVLTERDSACLAYVSRSGWYSARSLRGAGASGHLVVESMEREQLRVSGAPRAALFHGVVPPSAAGWTLSGLALPPLEGYSPQEDGAYAMALSAR